MGHLRDQMSADLELRGYSLSARKEYPQRIIWFTACQQVRTFTSLT